MLKNEKYIFEILTTKKVDAFLLTGAEVCKCCRSRQELSNEHLLAKAGFDTAEKEPFKTLRCFNSFFQYTFQAAFTLIAHGADVEAPDQEDGTRPLHHAAGKGDIRMLDVLLGGGPRDRAPERDATKTRKSTNRCL